eukprot:TRINITY_DN2460_c0_g1_i5.p1 TRINITY_DN2460_c0_g1~~TRINITY_DN2460_c0_g1_i5.p1  ORF type:complete len:869 (+),score=143.10 TRINITY_DN2460_c0_g1_i5:212-2608(+)
MSKADILVAGILQRQDFTRLAERFRHSQLARDLARRDDLWRLITFSEDIYLQNLRTISEVSQKTISKIIHKSNRVPNSDKCTLKQFQIFEDIKEVTRKLHKGLTEIDETKKEPFLVLGKVFNDAIQDIVNHYSNYLQCFSETLLELIKLRRTNHDICNITTRVKIFSQHNLGIREVTLPVHGLLELPLNRLMDYVNYLREIHSLTPPDNRDLRSLENAKDEIVKLNLVLEQTRSNFTKLIKMITIVNTLKFDSNSNDHRNFWSLILSKELPPFICDRPALVFTEKKTKEGYIYIYQSFLIFIEFVSPQEKQFDGFYLLPGAQVTGLRPIMTEYSFNLCCSNGKTLCIGGKTEAEAAALIKDLQQLTEVVNPLSIEKFSGSKSDILFQEFMHHLNQASRQQYPAQDFMKNKRCVDSDRFVLSLQVQRRLKTGDELLDDIPMAVVNRITKAGNPLLLKGPDEEDTKSVKSIPDRAAAQSVSTLPSLAPPNTSAKVPIPIPRSDRYRLASINNRTIVVVGDQGSSGARAAEMAANTVFNKLLEFHPAITDLRDAGKLLLTAFGYAHEAIVNSSSPNADCGTTSLFAGFTLEVEYDKNLTRTLRERSKKSNRSYQRVFIALSVGNIKAYRWSRSSMKIEEIQPGFMDDNNSSSTSVSSSSSTKQRVRSKSNTIGGSNNGITEKSSSTVTTTITDDEDPGGRLGPYLFRDGPDLRNLNFFTCLCDANDLIFICTNGVYHNFDPEKLGLSPGPLLSLHSTTTNKQIPTGYKRSPSKSKTEKYSYPTVDYWEDIEDKLKQQLKSR